MDSNDKAARPVIIRDIIHYGEPMIRRCVKCGHEQADVVGGKHDDCEVCGEYAIPKRMGMLEGEKEKIDTV